MTSLLTYCGRVPSHPAPVVVDIPEMLTEGPGAISRCVIPATVVSVAERAGEVTSITAKDWLVLDRQGHNCWCGLRLGGP